MTAVCRWSWSRVVCLILLIATGPFAAASAFAAEADDAYTLAVTAYKQKRWTNATRYLREYLDKHPKHVKVPYARLYLGLSLVTQNQFRDARTVLREYVTDYPDSRNRTHAMYRVAECSYMLSDLKAAESEFNTFIKAAPEDALLEWALPYLGDVELQLKKDTRAEATFRKSLEAHPEGQLAEDSSYGLARALEGQKKVDDAIVQYEKIAANRSSSRAAQSQMNIGTLYFDTQKFSEATTAFAAVDANFPESDLVPSARLNAGFAHYQLKQFDQAIRWFDKASTDEPQKVVASYWKGLSLKATEKYREAADVLLSVREAGKDDAVIDQIVFQAADCELRDNKLAKAETLFVEVATNWPKSDVADDAMHFAGEVALQQAIESTSDEKDAHLDRAATHVDGFRKQFPTSGLRLRQQLLGGRIHDVRARHLLSEDKKDEAGQEFAEAIRQFQTVATSSKIMSTKSRGRFQLARALQAVNKHEDVIEAVKPLVADFRDGKVGDEFLPAVIILGDSQLKTEKYEDAAATMQSYIDRDADGAEVAQARVVRVLAFIGMKEIDKASDELDRLLVDRPGSAEIPRAIYQLAEAAYDLEDWDKAIRFFGAVVKLDGETPYDAASQSGLGWSHYNKMDFIKAAAEFEAVVKNWPEHELAPKSGYVAGISWKEIGQAQKAKDAFQAVVERHQGTFEAYESSRELARLERIDGDVKAADKAYQTAFEELKKQPNEKQENLDLLINEWALLHYESQDFKRSDELFKVLISERPGSRLAFDARYSLAESLLIEGKLKEAEASFREIADADQASAAVREDALHRLVGIAAENSEWQTTVERAKQLASKYPESRHLPETRFHQGRAHFNLEDYASAWSTLSPLAADADNKSLIVAKWFPHVWRLLAESGLRQKKYDDVEKLADRLRTELPDAVFAYQVEEVLARCYYKQTRFDDALKACERVLDSKDGARTETAARAQLVVGDVMFVRKKYEEAYDAYFNVYALYKGLDEYRARACLQAGLCEEKQNLWKDAASTYETLIKEFPESEAAKQAGERVKTARRNADIQARSKS